MNRVDPRPACVLVALAIGLCAACSSRERPRGAPPPLAGDGGGADAGSGAGADLPEGCVPGAQWVYLIDHDRSFIRFRPDVAELTVLGALECPAGEATPFSMSIGRDGYARVLYNDGRMFLVSIGDLSCTPAAEYEPGQMGFELFGMSYSADALGSTDETLFIGGGRVLSEGGDAPASLGRVDAGMRVQMQGALGSLPELSGTGGGDLWGFFPSEAPLVVREIDKATGAALQTFDVDAVGDGGETLSYAFAFWGGRFYIFYKSERMESSSAWALTPDLGSLEVVIPATGHRIVGAGVSTCAPAQLI